MNDDRPHVAELVAPRWAGGRTAEAITPAPSHLQVEQALRDLDGSQLNDLYLKTSDELTYLGICGGAGRYSVTVADHHERFAQLLSTPDRGGEDEIIMCGGQLSRFPRRYLVDLQTALTAAMHYLDTGQAAPALSWKWYG